MDFPAQMVQRLMPELLHQRLKQKYDAGELRLRLDLGQVAAMADDIGLSSEAEAVQLFCRLGKEHYFSATDLDKPIATGLGQRFPLRGCT